MKQLLEYTNKTKYTLLYNDERDPFDRKTINSKIQGKENILTGKIGIFDHFKVKRIIVIQME